MGAGGGPGEERGEEATTSGKDGEEAKGKGDLGDGFG